MKKFLNWLKNPSSDFALFIILLILANIVGHNAFLRLDLTQQKSYSLSKSSKQIVKNLEEPLSVKVFFDDNLPAPYSSYAQYIKDLLVEYEGAANRNFSKSFMDMSDPESQDLAASYGLHQLQIQEVKNNEVGLKAVYMGLVVTYGDSVEVLDGVTSIDGFELNLTSTISKMISKVDALSGLGKGNKIGVTLYMSSALKSLRISGIDEVEKYSRQAFDSVNRQNLDRLDFNVVNPLVSEADSLSETYGLQTISFQNASGQIEKAVFGMVISYGENFRALPLSIERGFFGYSVGGLEKMEESLNLGIQSLLSKTTQIGFVVGHNEHSLNNEQDSANFKRLVSGMYDLVELDLYADDVPAGMNTIIIDGPKYDYSEEELYRIDQFIMKGGNVMFFMDPMIEMGQSQYGGQGTFRPLNLNVDRLLDSYGVKIEKSLVMDKQCYENQSQQYGKLSLYWAPMLQKKEMNQKSPISSNLGYVIMLQNGAVDASSAKENKDVKVTVLAKTSPEAWQESENIMLNPLVMGPPSELHSYDLAVMLEGKFQSAFDEAPVKHLIDDDGNEVALDTTGDEFQTTGHIGQSRMPGKIFVVGSSQVTTSAVLDSQGTTPVSLFLMNAVDYMNGNEDLCTMRTKSLSPNTLNIRSQALAQLIKYFNTAGLVILVVITGLIVWVKRSKRRTAIRKLYNPNDARTVEKKRAPRVAKEIKDETVEVKTEASEEE